MTKKRKSPYVITIGVGSDKQDIETQLTVSEARFVRKLVKECSAESYHPPLCIEKGSLYDSSADECICENLTDCLTDLNPRDIPMVKLFTRSLKQNKKAKVEA